jgi:hypothetical protein
MSDAPNLRAGGWGRAAGWGLLALVLSASFSLAVHRSIAPANDLWDYAQEARQIARGEGFTSLYTYPALLDVPGPEGQAGAPFPVRWRLPLFAALGAVLLSLGIPLPLGFFLVGVASHALLVALVFLLGTHLHSARAGAIAAACAVASPLLLDAFSPALSQAPAAALALGVWLLLLRGPGPAATVGAALCAAAAWYLRGESLLMVPVWIWIALRKGGAMRAAIFGGVYAGLCLPWPVYLDMVGGSSAPIQGNPMLLYTPEYPGYSSSRTYGEPLPGAFDYAFRHPGTFAWRWVKDVAGFGIDLLAALGPVAMGLAIAGLLLREAKERWASLRPAWPLLVAGAVQIAAFACLERSPRFLVPVVPLACVTLGLAAAPALDRICGRPRVMALIAILILERAVVVAFDTREAARRFPPMPASAAAELGERLGPKRSAGAPAPAASDGPAASAAMMARAPVIWSDAPDWVAWHFDRPALLLPLWRQRERIAADYPVGAIFLSPNARARNLADGEGDWVRAIDQNAAIEKFGAPEVLPSGARVYLRRE